MKKKEKYIILTLMLSVLSMIQALSLWHIDISLSALLVGTNLITLSGIRNPYDVYHMALIVNTLAFYLLLVICTTLIFKYE